MLNYLSIDLESWTMPNIPQYSKLASEEKKKLDNGHVQKSTLKILSMLKKTKTKTTFFIVGQVYEWYPKLIEEIAKEGHEIAFHTYSHDAISNKTALVESIERSKKFIQRFRPIGFRAPRINFEKKYFTILSRYGFIYDSSIYGEFKSRFTYKKVSVFPVSLWKKLPIGSGYFIGLLGTRIKWLYRELNKQKIPFISFLHNWQILSPIKPAFPTRKYLLTHPHYFPYLKNTADSFEYLLEQFSVSPMKNLLKLISHDKSKAVLG